MTGCAVRTIIWIVTVHGLCCCMMHCRLGGRSGSLLEWEKEQWFHGRNESEKAVRRICEDISAGNQRKDNFGVCASGEGSGRQTQHVSWLQCGV